MSDLVQEIKNTLSIEKVEIKDHPFMIGTQAHPEFKSRPYRPHPLFKEFIGTCVKK